MELSPSYQSLRNILKQEVPLIDVRAPIEFAQGSMPSAINLPLMFDEERAAVGTCYKQQGSQQAISLGHQLVSCAIKEQRLLAWYDACQRFPDGYLCCARGGMRSHIVQEWLHKIGINYPLIPGGYKALRQTAIDAINELVLKPTILIAGCTGNGKTLMVRELSEGIDLEGIARHRGSSFGRTLESQLSQATFENHLATSMLKKTAQHTRWIFEDEGKNIGANSLPENLRLQMIKASVVIIDDPFELRLARLKDEYFDRMTYDFIATYGEEQGWLAYSEYLHHGLFAIRRRLGSQRTNELTQLLDIALDEQKNNGSTEVHFSWLSPLLKEYYDPMYNYQLDKKQDRILFRGRYDDVQQWLIDNKNE